MDALKHLVANIPDWMKRLDELTDQIEKRQMELARVSESLPAQSRSVRNRGSTESLRPKDEPEAHPDTDADAAKPQPSPAPPAPPQARSPLETSQPSAAGTDHQPPTSPADSSTPSALRRQTSLVKAQASARARAHLRKRQRSDSIVSVDGGTPKFRTRSMIIVYYDSYVQSFFEELVKFVSASRNMMRKAKMAAKVAQIKRQAELDLPDGDDDDGSNQSHPSLGSRALEVDPRPLLAASPAPKRSLDLTADAPLEAAPASENSKEREEEERMALQYVSSRRMRPVTRVPNMLANAAGRPIFTRGGRPVPHGGPGGLRAARESPGPPGGQLPDVYDRLDKGLEYVQSTCEHAAHQFLRDGDCSDEVGSIQRRLRETLDLANGETERVRREEPEALHAPAPDALKSRSFRPQSMRREHSGPLAPGKDAAAVELEVDKGLEEAGEGEAKAVPKGTRMMQ